jgi:hypothetical protein
MRAAFNRELWDAVFGIRPLFFLASRAGVAMSDDIDGGHAGIFLELPQGDGGRRKFLQVCTTFGAGMSRIG